MNKTKYVLDKNLRGEAIISDSSLENFWLSEDVTCSSPTQDICFYHASLPSAPYSEQLHIMGLPFADGSNHPDSKVRQFPATLRYVSTKTPLYPALERTQSSGIFDINYQEHILTHCHLHDCGDMALQDYNAEALSQSLELPIRQFCSANAKFAYIGGDHSVTYHILKQLKQNGRRILYLHFDAHLDCGSDPLRLDHEVHHGNFVRHLLANQIVEHVIQLGVRGLRSLGQYYEHPRLSCIPAAQLNAQELQHILESLSAYHYDIYVSFDVDVLDPSVFPFVDFPSPGGPSVHVLLDVIRSLRYVPGIIGMDLVEGHGADINAERIPFQYDTVIHIFSQLLHMLQQSVSIPERSIPHEYENNTITK
ncbi:arginase family protein [Paenibacillus kandeliae]|uniref:arginase family protein n=1 Tax=Paenibacillus kandeliae TaxID=3231269 RepID=UPI0034598E59